MSASKKKKKVKGKVTKARSRQRKSSQSLRKYLPWCALIAGVAFVFFWPVIFSEFTELDDKYLILTGMQKFLNHPWKVWTASLYTPHYKPLVMLSWVLEGKLLGLKSEVLHFDNLLLHAVNSVLVFFVTMRFCRSFDITSKRSEIVSLFTALIFAAHPLHVESVAWAIERKDVMYTCFFLLGILSYYKYLDKPSLKQMLITTGCFGISMLSKAPAIMFPAILLLIDWINGRPLKLGRLTEKWPILIVFIAGLVFFGVFGGGKGKNAGATEGRISKIVNDKPISDVYPLTQLPSLYGKVALIGVKGTFWYLHSFLPIGLSLAYPYRSWLPGIGHAIHVFPLLLALAAFLIWKRRKRWPFLFFTHAFFFIALAPALIRTGLGKGIFLSDRYVYLGLLGLAMFVSGILLSWMDKKQWPAKRQYAIMGALVLVLGVVSFFHARTWHTGQTLWSNVIRKYPSIDYAYVNRAIWYKENNNLQKALTDLNSAVELDHFDEHSLIHRGTVLRQLGQNEKALADFDEVLKTHPDNEHAINGKANVLFEMGKYAEAEDTYSKGLEAKPRMITLMVNRAAARYYLGKYNEALEDLNNAAKRSPNYPGIYSKETVIYMALKDYENAVISAQKTAKLEPGNHANFGDLGTALQNLGRHQEAIDAFTQAIKLFDRGQRYYRGRAKSYEALGNEEAARRDRQKANSL